MINQKKDQKNLLKVFLRIKDGQPGPSNQAIVNINNQTQSIQYFRPKDLDKKNYVNFFNFDQIFGPRVDNQELFDSRIKGMIDNAIIDN